ncbi:MAG: HlyD family efflux transporter periplasmic adaptor subunit [Firmicutes bacterium]|nr:HlyD family efflux transporter periplasmic adaptor subunit [Bacillota bacterium]
MGAKVKKSLIAFLTFVLAASYVGYHIYKSSGSKYSSETVLNTVYSETIDAEMLFLREETVVESDASAGALQYAVPDGTKVKKNGVVARLYAAESEIAAQEELALVRNEIATFETIAGQTEIAGTNPDIITSRLNARLVSLQTALRCSRTEDFEAARSSVLEVLCQQQLITGEVTGFEEKLAALREQEAELLKKVTQPQSVVYAPVSGYFSGTADGYEGVFDLSGIDSVTVEQIRSIQPAVPAENAIGKIAPSHVWYAVTVLSAENARRLSLNSTICLIDPESGERIPVTVSAINQTNVESEAAVVLRGNTLDSTISGLRRATMQIEVRRYSGARVPRSAVHIEHRTRTITDQDGNKSTEEKDVQGVYIIYGEQLKFREISPIYWGDDFVICDLSASATFDVSMMKLYDQVVVGGKELYDGKEIR